MRGQLGMTLTILLGMMHAETHAELLYPNPQFAVGRGPSSVAIADLNADGNPDVVTANVFSNDVSVLLGRGDGTFAPEVRLPAGTGPLSVTVGDLNQDGRPDLAVSDSGDLYYVPNIGHEVSVFIGGGDGTFAPEVRYPVGGGPISVAIADLNGDGMADLAAANNWGIRNPVPGDVSVLLGNGDGTFRAEVRYPAGTGVSAVTVADFDRDGRLDLAVANEASGDVSMLPGLGDGTFAAQRRTPVGLGPVALVVADFNADSKPDLAVANSGSKNISLLLGNGDGTFLSGGVFGAGDRPAALVAGDLNSDGVQDLGVASLNTSEYLSGGVLILVGLGDGTFEPQVRYFTGDGLRAIGLGDFDGDGKIDVAVGNRGAFEDTYEDSISVLFGNGDGTFATEARYSAGKGLWSIALADFNADGTPDIVVADRHTVGIVDDPGAAYVLLGRQDGTLGPATRWQAGLHPFTVVVGDFDRDGNQDFAVVNWESADISIFLGRGDGTFKPQTKLAAGRSPEYLVVGDFNKDSLLDLAVTDTKDNDVSVFLGNGDGTFRPRSVFSTGTAAYAVEMGDFNGDGNQDLVVANTGDLNPSGDRGALSILLGWGDGSFQPRIRIEVGFGPYRIGSGDFDGDGRLDLAVGHRGSNELWILLGDGAGGFSPKVALPMPTGVQSIAVGDLNSDRKQDLAVLSGYSETRVLPGQGDGTFGSPTAYGVASSPIAIGIANLDSDRRPDLVVAFSGGVSVLLNTGPFPDTDGDGMVDNLDPCTDTDGDGLGDPLFPANTCALDDCPATANPGQEDADRDGIGDACDHCGLDAENDIDRDGLCGDVDNCPHAANPMQEDSDRDGSGDTCDNCPALPNADQADANHDGSGDACQPVLILKEIRQDGGENLEVDAFARDPNGDALMGSIDIAETANTQITIGNVFNTSNYCEGGFLPEGKPGEGIGYLEYRDSFGTTAYLFDLDSNLGCRDGMADYVLGLGPCVGPSPRFTELLVLPQDLTLPTPVCVRKHADTAGGMEFTIEAFDDSVLVMSGVITSFLHIPFENGLPARSDISALRTGADHRLSISVTDGNTLPVTVGSPFLYQGEQVLIIEGNRPPHAVLDTATQVECTSPAGGDVTLNGSRSTDDDSTPGTNDDIVSFEWFENPNQSGRASLGTGPILSATLPLGTHVIALVVTDSKGATDAAQTTVTVRDTSPPQLIVTLTPTVLWPPNHRLVQVKAAWQVSDVCDPAASVRLVSATSSEPDDAPGTADGNTTEDIEDVSIGAPDSMVLLRAERSGNGPGRVYTLTYAATDASGNTTSALGMVSVPHDEGTGPEPVMLSVEGDGTPGMAHIYWNAVGASLYDLIQGDLGQVTKSAGEIWLGRVHVLASGQTVTSYSEGSGGAIPTVGSAFFYLVQYRQEQSASGWGTESGPWPAEPTSCDIGCPGGASSVLASQSLRRK